MWTVETLDEYTEAMADHDAEAREAETGPGLLVIIDAGKLNMKLLADLFE